MPAVQTGSGSRQRKEEASLDSESESGFLTDTVRNFPAIHCLERKLVAPIDAISQVKSQISRRSSDEFEAQDQTVKAPMRKVLKPIFKEDESKVAPGSRDDEGEESQAYYFKSKTKFSRRRKRLGVTGSSLTGSFRQQVSASALD